MLHVRAGVIVIDFSVIWICCFSGIKLWFHIVWMQYHNDDYERDHTMPKVIGFYLISKMYILLCCFPTVTANRSIYNIVRLGNVNRPQRHMMRCKFVIWFMFVCVCVFFVVLFYVFLGAVSKNSLKSCNFCSRWKMTHKSCALIQMIFSC